ncbi:uncharacterized protein LOC143032674 [Oratosquilla oratoria]|uniref:uncharacterized protein LOC143032674 n=1 Tax=Oratosquilla oratoria TaxID=337810 RepID=UPI003F760414
MSSDNPYISTPSTVSPSLAFAFLNSSSFNSSPIQEEDEASIMGDEINDLGRVISTEDIRPQAEKIAAIRNFPKSVKLNELQQFIGLSNFYRKFIRNFAQIAKPFTVMMKGPCHKSNTKITLNWTKEADETFQILKDTLIQDVILSYPDFTNFFVLNTDASDFAIGVLQQPDENGSSTRVLQWQMAVGDFDLTIQYIPGRENVVADALSRIREVDHPIDTCIVLSVIKKKERSAQAPDEIIRWDPNEIRSKQDEHPLFLIAVPVKSKEAKEIDQAFVTELRKQFITDGGGEFVNKILTGVCTLLEVDKLTTPYHPSNNGLVEVANGTIVQILRSLTMENRSEGLFTALGGFVLFRGDVQVARLALPCPSRLTRRCRRSVGLS